MRQHLLGLKRLTVAIDLQALTSEVVRENSELSQASETPTFQTVSIAGQGEVSLVGGGSLVSQSVIRCVRACVCVCVCVCVCTCVCSRVYPYPYVHRRSHVFAVSAMCLTASGVSNVSVYLSTIVRYFYFTGVFPIFNTILFRFISETKLVKYSYSK